MIDYVNKQYSQIQYYYLQNVIAKVNIGCRMLLIRVEDQISNC